MPSKHVLRNFFEGGIYHIFNRGVEKRNIFLDTQDYNIFLYYVFIYLTPLDTVFKKYPRLPLRLQGKNLNKEIELITYCLMPNHFHLLIKQLTKDGTSKFLKQLTNAYTLYFNQKYDRVGPLVQGPFKAVPVDTNEQLLHINRYIHLNPVVSGVIHNIENYKWSSYHDYIGRRTSIVCSKEIILSQFSTIEKYRMFIQDHIDYAIQLAKIKHLTIES